MRMKCLGVPKGVQETWSQVLPVSSCACEVQKG
jgi:hypothetical protein